MWNSISNLRVFLETANDLSALTLHDMHDTTWHDIETCYGPLRDDYVTVMRAASSVTELYNFSNSLRYRNRCQAIPSMRFPDHEIMQSLQKEPITQKQAYMCNTLFL